VGRAFLFYFCTEREIVRRSFFFFFLLLCV